MANRTPHAALVSCFGDISPAFAAAFGARVDTALLLDARNADARAMVATMQDQHRAPRRHVLPTEIATTAALPASRVQVEAGALPTSRVQVGAVVVRRPIVRCSP